jgi:hypothetical protein
MEAPAAVDLSWIPLGAGAHVVRLSGMVYEAIAARLHRRPPLDLYHSALIVQTPTGRFTIEQTPAIDGRGESAGSPWWARSGCAPPEGSACSGTRSGAGATG